MGETDETRLQVTPGHKFRSSIHETFPDFKVNKQKCDLREYGLSSVRR